MGRKIAVSLILIAILSALGAGITVGLIHFKPKPPKVDRQRPPLSVQATTVGLQTLPEPFVGYGTAEAELEARVSAEVAGRVVELADQLKPGAAVRAGQLLVRIDEAEYLEKLEQAESLLAGDEATLSRLDLEAENLEALIAIAGAELEIAENEFRRLRRLREQEQASPREYDLASVAWHAARRQLQTLENNKALIGPSRQATLADKRAHQAAIELARIELQRCRITAPFDGRLVTVDVERGERVAAGRQVFSMLDPRRIEVPITLPASACSRVSVGDRTELTVDSMAGVAWTGRVARISPSADSTMRTFELYVEVDNAEQRVTLVPGFFVRADIEGALLHDVLVIPRRAVRDGQVFVAEDGTARPRRVTIERTILERAVVQGVRPGEAVITSNLNALYDEAPVQVIDGRWATGDAEAAEPSRPAGDSPVVQP